MNTTMNIEEYSNDTCWTMATAMAVCFRSKVLRKIRSAGEYVAVCRRMWKGPFTWICHGDGRYVRATRCGTPERRSVHCPTCGQWLNVEKTSNHIPLPDHQLTSEVKAYREYDGRLIATGWNHFTPKEWESVFPAFYRYWEKAAQRPNTVGSPYNPSPEVAFQYWRRKISAWICQALENEQSPIQIQQRRSWKKSRLRNAARAMNRTSACMRRGELMFRLSFTMKAAEALGRLCPELQRLTINELIRIRVEDRTCCGRIARKNIPWEFVAEQQKKLQADKSGRLRVAIATLLQSKKKVSVRALELAGWEKVREESSAKEYLSRFLSPEFPGVSIIQSAQIAQGTSPVELSNGMLSRHEAHDWLLHNPQWAPTQYLCSKLKNWVPEIRSVFVVRWLLAVEKRGGWQQLIKMRPVHGPAGQVGEFRFLDRVDEIQDEDLVRGHQTGVEEAFQHIADRMGAKWTTKHRDDLKIISSCPSSWPKPYRSMRLLNTPSALVREGEEVGHCVGGYIDAVKRGQCYIFSVIVKGKRSTVEVGGNGSILQHHGNGNGPPTTLQRAGGERLGSEDKRMNEYIQDQLNWVLDAQSTWGRFWRSVLAALRCGWHFRKCSRKEVREFIE